jgi:hypothetical protein
MKPDSTGAIRPPFAYAIETHVLSGQSLSGGTEPRGKEQNENVNDNAIENGQAVESRLFYFVGGCLRRCDGRVRAAPGAVAPG